MTANLEFRDPLSRAAGRRAARGRARASCSSTTVTARRRRSRARASTRCSSAGCATDPSQPNSLNLWVTGDNLRKGAALNAVQMAEVLLARPAGRGTVVNSRDVEYRGRRRTMVGRLPLPDGDAPLSGEC